MLYVLWMGGLHKKCFQMWMYHFRTLRWYEHFHLSHGVFTTGLLLENQDWTK